MKLVVGLGNPGLEYEKTRHNVGFMFLDYITKGQAFKLNKKFKAMEYETSIGNERVMFIKPLTFMNLSGEAVMKYVNFYKILLADILVIQDDMDMEIGNYKLLFNRGDGGHNGIKNIVSMLGSREFLRLKIGISKSDGDKKEYVLGRFSTKELEIIMDTFGKLAFFIDDYFVMNRDILMGKYNSREINKND